MAANSRLSDRSLPARRTTDAITSVTVPARMPSTATMIIYLGTTMLRKRGWVAAPDDNRESFGQGLDA